MNMDVQESDQQPIPSGHQHSDENTAKLLQYYDTFLKP